MVNWRSDERFPGTYSQWLWQRVRRLRRPTLVYLCALAVIFTVVTLLVRHELGYWYRRGVPGVAVWTCVLAGLGVNVVLTQVLHWYPTSLVGIPTERFSTMAPPTVILVCHAFVLFGVVALLALLALLRQPPPPARDP